MKEIIVITIIALILFFSIFCIIKSKRSGKKCIGCPYSSCPSKNKENCTCSKNAKK